MKQIMIMLFVWMLSMGCFSQTSMGVEERVINKTDSSPTVEKVVYDPRGVAHSYTESANIGRTSVADRGFERDMGVHQYIQWIRVCGTDLYLEDTPMSPGDTLTAYCQGKMVGARRIEECPDPDSCSYNVLTYMPIYLNNPWDTAVDCPEIGDAIDFQHNGLPVISIPTIVWTAFGDATTISGFIYDPDCCVLRGDINNDESIDISDLMFLIDFMFLGGPAPVCYMTMDANGSGQVDISDLTYMIEYMFVDGDNLVECE